MERVRRTISKYDLLRPDDRIAVAVSGGKDSLSLLKMLYEIEQDFPRSELLALIIDEGLDSYRISGIKTAKSFTKKLGIPIYELSFKNLYGFTVSEAFRSGALKSLGIQPCTLCGVLKRKALLRGAKEVDASVIATAHTLDDVVQTYLLNLLRGESNIKPIGLRNESSEVIPRIAPLRLIPQREIALYAYLEGIPFQSRTCPYTHISMRDEVRNFLTLYEREYPGSLYAFLSIFEKLIDRLYQGGEERCEVCGEPTSSGRRICRACELIDSVKKLMNR